MQNGEKVHGRISISMTSSSVTGCGKGLTAREVYRAGVIFGIDALIACDIL